MPGRSWRSGESSYTAQTSGSDRERAGRVRPTGSARGVAMSPEEALKSLGRDREVAVNLGGIEEHTRPK